MDPYKVSVWFREHFWKARVVEWDKHLDEIRQYVQEEQLAQHVQAVTAEHMAMLANARDIVAREMEKLLATVRESPAETLKVRDLIRLAETVIRGDRLVRDQTTEKVETQMDLSHLSEAELAEIERKLTGGATSGD